MREKILELLDKGVFVSGEKIAQRLGVSRTAVWKQVKSLQELGYTIESVRNKGYRLIVRPDVLIPEEIKKGLNTRIIGREIRYFKTISSTNAYAKQLVEKNIQEGTIVVADVQTKGRGRKNRTWSSNYGGLWFSFVLYPHIPPERGMLVTMASSVAVAHAIKENTNLNPIIKWPNDLLIHNKKICGILTELDAEMDRINYSIVGIGLNVNNELDVDLKKIASSIYLETGIQIPRVRLLRSILTYFDEQYDALKSDNYEKIRNDWFTYANIIGKKIQVQTEKTTTTGTVSTIDDSGCLILETNQGSIRIVSGDVTYL